MVLSRPDILQWIAKGELCFDPPVQETAIEQVSIDLRLGHIFTHFKPPTNMGALRVTKQLFTDSSHWQDERAEDVYFLKKHEFVIAQTLELVKIPNGLMGLVEGKSSWARIGVSVHVTAPKIDPGFGPATISLELFNHGDIAVELRPKEHSICQLILLPLSTTLSDAEAYGAKIDHIFAKQTKPIPTA